MWALGVIAFELLTGTMLFAHGESRGAAIDKLAGRATLPWEAAGKEAKLAKLRRLKGTVLACLDRDPAKRPTARALVNSWNRFFDATQTHGAPPALPWQRTGAGTAGWAGSVRTIDGTINSANTRSSGSHG